MSRHPLLYEINTRCWLAALSDKAGRPLTLADVPDSEFDFWHHCGFTHLWLMGVWTLGARGRAWSRKCFGGREDELRCEDIAGSPYAITGYTVSRNLGGESALTQFRRKLKTRGIKLVLDFIPNHTALDHPWVKTQSEFYITSETQRAGTTKPYRGATKWFARGDCGHGSPWVDTLQFDYRNPELRKAMIGELLAVSQKCDGVRCDMAMLLLNDVFARTWREFPSAPAPTGTEFWKEAIDSIRACRRDFLLLAEAYWDLEPRLQELGFDYTYDKRLYDRIVAHDSVGVSDYLQSLSREFLAHSAHFIENHDERRVALLLSFDEHRAAALLVLTLPGLRLVHDGQLGGLKAHANVHFARRNHESADETIAEFYQRLLESIQQSAVGQGEWQLLKPQPASPDNATQLHLAAVQWQASSAVFNIVAANFGGTRSQGWISLCIDGLASADWRLSDLLGNEVYERSGAELAQRGLYLDLPPHGAQLFHCEQIQK